MAILLIVGTASTVHGLTLFAHEVSSHEVHLHVRVDEGNLTARSLAGTNEVNGQELDQSPRRIDASMTSWRGFDNVTELEIVGEGTVLVYDGSSGLIVPVPTATNEGRPTNSSGGQDGSSPTNATPNATASRGGDATGDIDAGQQEEDPLTSSNSGKGDGSPLAGLSTEGQNDEAEDEGVASEPVAVALTVLAVGAFAVERLVSSGSREGEP